MRARSIAIPSWLKIPRVVLPVMFITSCSSCPEHVNDHLVGTRIEEPGIIFTTAKSL